jgi:hypothetical protein
MRQMDGFWSNHIDGAIRALANSAPHLFEPWPWSLVTSLDSLRDLRDIPKREAFKSIADEVVVVGHAVLVKTAGLIRVAKEGTLTGFDEVWFLGQPPASAPPVEAHLVAPRNAATDDLTAVLVWMKAEACGLGLGDGIGLNYVAISQAIASELERVVSARK